MTFERVPITLEIFKNRQLPLGASEAFNEKELKRHKQALFLHFNPPVCVAENKTMKKKTTKVSVNSWLLPELVTGSGGERENEGSCLFHKRAGSAAVLGFSLRETFVTAVTAETIHFD